MRILRVLDRCMNIERTAGEIYDLLAARSVRDGELRAFWSRMAADERTHARNLEKYRAIVAAEDQSHPTLAEGFEDDLTELEELVSQARARAAVADSADDAFAIALDLELSELDLHARLSAPRPRGEDVENEFRAIHDAAPGGVLDVLPLRG